MSDLLQALAAICGTGNLITEDISERYQHDWSAEPPGLPLAVVRPGTVAEVSGVLRACHEHGQPVVVQGGLTGLCGGGNPRPGEVALSLERLQGIEEIDVAGMTMTVRAGTALEDIQQAAEEAGFIFPLDLGARGTCNIGGNISTNAGGNQVLRFGMTRALVLGLEAVLADGTVISSMNRMLKNNAGYDLKQLFIGTEGTLGIVTRAVLRLYPKPRSRNTALLALSGFDQVATVLRTLSAELAGTLSAFEVMWAGYFDFIIDKVPDRHSPFDQKHPLYVLVEMEGADPDNDRERFENILAGAFEAGCVADAVVAGSERERDSFWQIRDGVGEIGPFLRTAANFDVSIPISSMSPFLETLKQRMASHFPDSHIMVFGHVADSNLHIICSAQDRAQVKAIYAVVYALTGEFQGSVSAEHGIGVQKKSFLGYSRSEEEIALMRLLKQSMDPKGILNAGRVVDI